MRTAEKIVRGMEAKEQQPERRQPLPRMEAGE